MTWADDVRNRLENVTFAQPTVPSIYKVPDLLRRLNHEAYTPQLISIGPFHYGSQKLQSMENCKLKFLKFFMEKHNVNWVHLEEFVTRNETKVRNSYAEAFPNIESDDFMTMILFDASFIIVLFLIDWLQKSKQTYEQAGDIKIESWMTARIQLDLILLENQLPFSFIDDLYVLFAYQIQHSYPKLIELTFNYFDCFNTRELKASRIVDRLDVKHFTDLLRHFYLHSERGGILSPRSVEVQEMFCASKLAERGMKFKPNSTACCLDMTFDNIKGVLEIPTFNLSNDRQICARNVVAFEQCHYPEYAYVTDYFCILGLLIHARSDVDLLLQEGIIVMRPSGDIMAALPNDLCTNISSWKINKDYHHVCEELTTFYRKHRYPVLGSDLRKDYFNTPWMAAANVGAIILLLFTLVQTVCSVLQTFKLF